MNYCPNCGSKIIDKTNFCGNCGHKLSEKITFDEPDSASNESNGDFFIQHFHFRHGANDIKWGFLNEKSEWIVEPKFDNPPPFFLDNHKYARCTINNKEGVIDRKGNWIIQPLYENVTVLESGYIIVEVNEKYGVIDSKGNWIIQPQFDEINLYRNSKYNGTSDDRIEALINDKWGVIDGKGNWIIQPQFDKIHYTEEYQVIPACVDDKWGVIDREGNWIIQPQFDDIYTENTVIPACVDKKWGVIDREGNWMIQPKFDKIGFIKETGFIPALINHKWGVIDGEGNWIIQPQFDEIGFTQGSLSMPLDMRACVNDKWGVIDDEGNWIIQPQFDEIRYTEEYQVIPALLDDKWGVIDGKGNWIIQPQFDEIFYTKEYEIISVCLDEKWGLFDDKGNWIIQPQFDDLDSDSYGNIVVQVNERCGIIDKNGAWLINPEYDEITNVWAEPNFLLRVEAGEKLGFWNPKTKSFLIEVDLENTEFRVDYEKLQEEEDEYQVENHEGEANEVDDFDDDWFDEDNSEDDVDRQDDVAPISQSDIDIFLGEFTCENVAVLGHDKISDILGRVFGDSKKFFELFYQFSEDQNEIESSFHKENTTFHYLYLPTYNSLISKGISSDFFCEMILVFSTDGNTLGTLYCGTMNYSELTPSFQFDTSDYFEVAKEKAGYAKIIKNNNEDDWFELPKPADNRLLSLKLTRLSFKIEDLINAIQDLFESQETE